ncbi:elicitor [Fusarium pseudoanthophilum]|uniref:Elicitor n=1 Tax=Fusarium pseudoanthophilum TaxID=48495 RepID=A0A8H5Q584_9HYPO|nr:elicitor [Fusarium pseudoanthophilum]
MKFSALATVLVSLGLGPDLAVAKCDSGCYLKVCDWRNLKGNCHTKCYQGKDIGRVVKVDKSGLKGPIVSAKSSNGCGCTFGYSTGSACQYVGSDSKGTNFATQCLKGVDEVQCNRL